MTPTDLKLYELLGDNTLSFGCVLENICGFHIKFASRYGDEGGFRTDDGGLENMEMMKIIGHEPTIADLHRWMNGYCDWPNNNNKDWAQSPYAIHFSHTDKNLDFKIPYDSSKSLLSQSEETKSLIISLITSHS